MCLTFLVVYQLLVCFGSGEREKESGSDLRVALSSSRGTSRLKSGAPRRQHDLRTRQEAEN